MVVEEDMVLVMSEYVWSNPVSRLSCKVNSGITRLFKSLEVTF
jgi:hypothetical protein